MVKTSKSSYKDREKLKTDPEPVISPVVASFKNGNTLLVHAGKDSEFVQLLDSKGEIQITIEMTDKGAVFHLSCFALSIHAKEKFTVDSPVIELNATKVLNLNSEGDLHQKVKNDSYSTARIQNIVADLGNVNIKANDDVRLDGERVKLNCTD